MPTPPEVLPAEAPKAPDVLKKPSAAADTPGGEVVLTAAHLAQRSAAKRRRGKVDRAVVVATVSAWSLAVFAALSWPFGLFSLKGAFIAAGLSACAWFEFRGRNGLRRLEVGAPARLAWNQLGLAGVISVYCVWSAYAAWTGPSAYAQAIERTPELAEMLEPFAGVIRQVTVGAYGLVLVLTLMVQAGVIGYYRSRRKFVEAYLSETPGWVLALEGA